MRWMTLQTLIWRRSDLIWRMFVWFVKHPNAHLCGYCSQHLFSKVLAACIKKSSKLTFEIELCNLCCGTKQVTLFRYSWPRPCFNQTLKLHCEKPLDFMKQHAILFWVLKLQTEQLCCHPTTFINSTYAGLIFGPSSIYTYCKQMN